MSDTPSRKNVHLAPHVLRFLEDAHPSLSGRLSRIVDRYSECMRRTSATELLDHLSGPQLTALTSVFVARDFSHASLIFDAFPADLDASRQHDLANWFRGLSPIEQCAVIEYLETHSGAEPTR